MNKQLAWESLIGIVVGVFILGIVLIGLGNLISYSNYVLDTYGKTDVTFFLKNNLSNIVRTLDTTGVKQWEIFYIYKDVDNREFQIFTGATNVWYKYIDEYGNKVDDINTFEDDIYSRILWVERDDTSVNTQNQVVRASIKKLVK